MHRTSVAFARAGKTDDTEYFSVLDREGNVMHGVDLSFALAEVLGHILKLNQKANPPNKQKSRLPFWHPASQNRTPVFPDCAFLSLKSSQQMAIETRSKAAHAHHHVHAHLGHHAGERTAHRLSSFPR